MHKYINKCILKQLKDIALLSHVFLMENARDFQIPVKFTQIKVRIMFSPSNQEIRSFHFISSIKFIFKVEDATLKGVESQT